MRALISGANGFLGTEVTSQLELLGVKTIRGTRNQPIRSMNDSAFQDIDSLIWASASVTPQVAQKDPALCEIEIDDFATSLNRLLVISPKCQILFASSGGTVYDPAHSPPYAEDSPLLPNNRYGEMKLKMEGIVKRSGGTSLRLGNLYGPGQRARNGLGVIAYWLLAARTGKPIQVFGSGQIARDYVYVGDAANAIVKAVLCGSELPPDLNIGSGKATSLDELLSLVEAAVAPLSMSIIRADSNRPYDRLATYLNIQLAEDVLGWTPSVSLAAGIARTWEALRFQLSD